VTYEVDIIDELTTRARGYQVLYYLGSDPATVRNLRPGEAQIWIDLAQEVLDGKRTTPAHVELAAKCNPVMLRYVATGRMSA
jgi:hypothetical protein